MRRQDFLIPENTKVLHIEKSRGEVNFLFVYFVSEFNPEVSLNETISRKYIKDFGVGLKRYHLSVKSVTACILVSCIFSFLFSMRYL
ncbi:hypothetical protein SDC9_159279 [bioreactor metagenome]|uniref:Uncharacterized protein n=1 Tax=bioreactor metagenome TaxID=1076179 RepID=A0A645FDC9_9ZZZZ